MIEQVTKPSENDSGSKTIPKNSSKMKEMNGKYKTSNKLGQLANSFVGTKIGSFVSGDSRQKKMLTSPDGFYRHKGSSSVNMLNQNLYDMINMNPHK